MTERPQHTDERPRVYVEAITFTFSDGSQSVTTSHSPRDARGEPLDLVTMAQRLVDLASSLSAP